MFFLSRAVTHHFCYKVLVIHRLAPWGIILAVENLASEVRQTWQPALTSSGYHQLRLWASNLIALSLSFPLCKMGMFQLSTTSQTNPSHLKVYSNNPLIILAVSVDQG